MLQLLLQAIDTFNANVVLVLGQVNDSHLRTCVLCIAVIQVRLTIISVRRHPSCICFDFVRIFCVPMQC